MGELAEHRGYLTDTRRVAAYRAALAEVVEPGMVVLDLGAGTGIMGLLALEAGAARVHAVDNGPILEVARQIARANGAGAITHHRSESTRVTLPEPADLVVCDQHDPTGVRAGLLHSFHDAHQRLLTPGGRAVPAQLQVCAAPVTSEPARESVAFWGSRPAGFDTGVVVDLAANDLLWLRVAAGDLLAPPVCAEPVDTLRHGTGPIRLAGDVVAERDGVVHALAVWFRSRLSPGVLLTNDPTDPEAIDRDQTVLPLARPLEVAAGDRLRLEVSVGAEVHWRVGLGDAGDTRGARDTGDTGDGQDTGAGAGDAAWQSTMAGHRLGPDDLMRRLPHHRPVLSSRGRLLARVAALVEAGTTVADLRQVVATEFPDELRTQPADEVVDWAVKLLGP